MEPRTRLALSGAAVIAVSVSVVASVVATSVVALADAPGAGIGAHAVRLPAATPTALDPAEGESVVEQQAEASIAPVAETLPAPAPAPVIAPSQTVAAPPVEVEAEILATGSWQPVREWASTQGWSSADVDAWISKFRSTHEFTQDDTVVSPEGQKTSQTPVPAGSPSDSLATTPGDGSKKDRSPGSPDLSD